MSTMLYGIASREIIFNGEHDFEDMHKDALYWYESDDLEESLNSAREYSDADTIHVWRSGIMRNVYQWIAIEIENDEVIGCEVKIFDPLDRFEMLREAAKRAHLFSRYGYDLISYIVGKRRLLSEFKRNGHWFYLYRYENTAFGDFTAYEEEGSLWLPETFSDYGIMKPAELVLAMDEGVTFWQDWQTDDPEARLLYKIFQNY